MTSFNYETDFELDNEILFSEWISKIIVSENKTEGEINYIFCDDDYLHKINLEYLQHDDLTDIISFDYSISIERVLENADEFQVEFDNELKRVMAHGVLHYAGYKDKTEKDAGIMRTKENEKIALFDN